MTILQTILLICWNFVTFRQFYDGDFLFKLHIKNEALQMKTKTTTQSWNCMTGYLPFLLNSSIDLSVNFQRKCKLLGGSERHQLDLEQKCEQFRPQSTFSSVHYHNINPNFVISLNFARPSVLIIKKQI